MSLDVLFQQILQSEQKAEDRRAEITSVNNEITDREKEIKELRGIILNANLKLKDEKRSTLFNEQAEVEILTKQHESLLQQRDKLKNNCEQLKALIKTNVEKIDKEFDNFLEKIDSFVETYNLTNSEVKHFQKQQLDELEKLKQDEINEEQRLVKVKKQEENRNAVSEHHACLQAEVSHLRATIIEFTFKRKEKSG